LAFLFNTRKKALSRAESIEKKKESKKKTKKESYPSMRRFWRLDAIFLQGLLNYRVNIITI
jgi:hypothetical protein